MISKLSKAACAHQQGPRICRCFYLSIWTFCTILLLTGCSSGQSGANDQSVKITPLAITPGSSTGAALKESDWPTYHRDTIRTGYLANEPDPHQLTRAWETKLDGNVYAEPLVIGNRIIVATEGDSLYSLDAQTGEVQWRTNIGTPVPLPTLPCGDINPLGITGTPAYDPVTGMIFAVGEITGPAHILVGVDANTGQVRVRRVADGSSMDPRVHQQRAALVIANSMVYVAYGGLAGDCGNYHGTVVASRTDGQGPLLSYQVPTTREGGIWAPSGPAVDATGHIYVSVGNGEATGGSWDYTDSVLRLSSTLQLEDSFAPTQWPSDNNTDTDLGSMGPTLLPNGLIFVAGKSGIGYLLQANALGGVGGEIASVKVCNGQAMGGTATVGSQVFVPCTDGMRRVTVGPGNKLTVDWHASNQINQAPIVGGHTLYSLDAGGTLYALDVNTGQLRTELALGEGVSRFATPTLSAHHLFVGTNAGVVAVAML